MVVTVAGVKVECIRGDIVRQKDIVAVVNAANAWLKPGGGVAGAIHRAAGPGLEEECKPLAPIKPGAAVITSGHNLPNKYVIHCLGPVYGVDRPEAEILARCYENALDLGEKHQVESIAFPAISTGIFGYPVEEAAAVAIKTVINKVPRLKYVKRIRFVLYSQSDLELHKQVLRRLTGAQG